MLTASVRCQGSTARKSEARAQCAVARPRKAPLALAAQSGAAAFASLRARSRVLAEATSSATRVAESYASVGGSGGVNMVSYAQRAEKLSYSGRPRAFATVRVPGTSHGALQSRAIRRVPPPARLAVRCEPGRGGAVQERCASLLVDARRGLEEVSIGPLECYRPGASLVRSGPVLSAGRCGTLRPMRG